MTELELINEKLNDLHLMQQSSQSVIKSMWKLLTMVLEHDGFIPTEAEKLIIQALNKTNEK